MWRTPVSVLFSGILGSALATILYMSWLGGSIPTKPDDLRTTAAVFLVASCVTITGAFLLSLAQFFLSGSVHSERILDSAVVAIGAVAGAAILGAPARDAAADFALLGGFYGFTTALLFVLFQRLLGARRAAQV